MKKLLVLIVGLILFGSIMPITEARSVYQINDWYIKDFKTDIVVNPDTSLTITEKILADCGDLYGKHGIFRTIPTFYQETRLRRIQTPVTLLSITDFSGNPQPFTTIHNPDSITWKIGDPDVTVLYEQEYKIVYTVENAVRTRAPNQDELYWNLNGDFWDIETDAFTATIHLPQGVTQANSKTEYYYGRFGEKRKDNVQLTWLDQSTLQVKSEQTMYVREGITLSVVFPKGIIVALPVSLWNQYQQWTIYMLPLLILLLCLLIWRRYGKDRDLGKAVVPEYGPPADYDLLELAMTYNNASFKNSFISAAIMDLATRKVIQIKKVVVDDRNKITDCTFVYEDTFAELSKHEQLIVEGMWGSPTPSSGEKVKLSDLADRFYEHIPKISKSVKDSLLKRKVFTNLGFKWRLWMGTSVGIAFIVAAALISMGLLKNIEHGIIIAICMILILVFSQFMPKLTAKGYEIKRHLRGFYDFMNTAEKHRQVFFEQENIFEKLLPYAIVFGLVKRWVTAANKIYADQSISHTSLHWASTIALGDIANTDSFADSLSSFSSSMTSTMASSPSSSGSDGGGSSGGGGGGGGGGGW